MVYQPLDHFGTATNLLRFPKPLVANGLCRIKKNNETLICNNNNRKEIEKIKKRDDKTRLKYSKKILNFGFKLWFWFV